MPVLSSAFITAVALAVFAFVLSVLYGILISTGAHPSDLAFLVTMAISAGSGSLAAFGYDSYQVHRGNGNGGNTPK